MTYLVVPFPVTLVTLSLEIKIGHEVLVDALDVVCTELTRDLFAIAKFSFIPPCIRRPR